MSMRNHLVTLSFVLALVAPATAGAKLATFPDGDHGAATAGLSGHGANVNAVRKTRHGSVGVRLAVSKTKPRTAPVTTTPSTPRVIYIQLPAESAPANPVVDPTECMDSGNSCTAIQDCVYWGENCDSLPQEQPGAQVTPMSGNTNQQANGAGAPAPVAQVTTAPTIVPQVDIQPGSATSGSQGSGDTYANS